MNSINVLFNNKNKVKFYVPLGINKNIAEGFVVEILDTISAYMSPIAYGISKGDIYDYITSPLYVNMDMLTYLKHKRYVADEAEFKNILLKYSDVAHDNNTIECYEIAIDCSSVTNNAINESELSNIIVALTNGHLPYDVSSNIDIKKAYYLKSLCKFSYIVPV